MNLDLAGRPIGRAILDRIRKESRDESEKGRWFEQLFMRVGVKEPEFDIDGIWRWAEWPEREMWSGLDGRDIGINLMAWPTSGDWIDIQCKCHDDQQVLGESGIDKFLGGSLQPVFRLRWAVATCGWGPNAERAIRNTHPEIRQIDFRQYLDVQVEERDAGRPVQEPWPLRADAIEDAVTGLANHDRGRLIMACGIGRKFTSPRIAKQIVEDGQRVLFATPTIALVSRARLEWLRHTTRKLACIVVCSDPTAGRDSENEDIRVSEPECPVTTDPGAIARSLTGNGATRVVFRTYHSLGRVNEAQVLHGAPAFDLAIDDEAHRTTGAVLNGCKSGSGRKVDFQEFHDDARLNSRKRLYMTATPRLYTERSKGKLAEQGCAVGYKTVGRVLRALQADDGRLDGGTKGVCTVAALMLCNACLPQPRLRDEPEMKIILRLDKVVGATHPRKVLDAAREVIIEKDYAPASRPALAVLGALREGRTIDDADRLVAERAKRVADSLSDLGYDHAGPFYHRILGSTKSYGAFYTNNLSEVLLSGLALDLIDRSDTQAVGKLRITEPACGTGTLIMAALQTIKARVSESGEMSDEDRYALPGHLVEDVLCGLDINQYGIQLAACNMTLGAPTVDCARMNLVTMPHGPQAERPPKARSLEILTAAEDSRAKLQSMIAPTRSLEGLDAAQVTESAETRFPLRGLDAVIMNGPFTTNENRGRKYGAGGRRAMQRHELDMQAHLTDRDPMAGAAVTANSSGTFFSPLADMLPDNTRGTLAKVIPTTACTNTSRTAEHRFLAERFQIETVVTSHDPHRPNFSENTAIHKSLLICRRRSGNGARKDRPTHIVVLRTLPATPEEAIEAAETIETGTAVEFFTVYEQPEKQIRRADWRPCQFLDPELVGAAMRLEREKALVPLGSQYRLGPAGQRIRDAFRPVDRDADGYHVFWGRSKHRRTTMEPVPGQKVTDKKPSLAARYRQQAGHILLAAKFRTDSGRILAIFSGNPALGSMWVPIQNTSTEEAKARCGDLRPRISHEPTVSNVSAKDTRGI